MNRLTHGDVLLVGSLPYETAEEALTNAGRLGDAAPCIPDGEVGARQAWTGFLEDAFDRTAGVELSREPESNDLAHLRPDQRPDVAAIDAWTKTYKLPDGADSLRFATLGYADAAIDSYRSFTALRERGVIAEGVRFQVSLPSTGSGPDTYFDDPSQWPIVNAAFVEAVGREIEAITQVIPPEDLAIQFDLAWEVVDLSAGDDVYVPFWPEATYSEKLRRHAEDIGALTALVPDEALLGLHLCYGTWGGWPMTEMSDMRLCVDFSNAMVSASQRRVDYIHMPVAKNAGESFFDALADLDIGDTRIFLGLIHFDDDVDDCVRIIKAASASLSEFGVAAVCGYGREDQQQVSDAIDLHCECAAALREMRGAEQEAR